MSSENGKEGLLERIIFAAAMSWLSGNPVPLKIDGTLQQVEAVKRAFDASKDFINELHNPKATSASVMELLQKKHEAADNFKEQLGIAWLL
jgi:hypothetical protein